MTSLFNDPIAWWPLGFVLGGLAGAVLARQDRRRAARLGAERIPDTVDELVTRWRELDAAGDRRADDPGPGSD